MGKNNHFGLRKTIQSWQNRLYSRIVEKSVGGRSHWAVNIDANKDSLALNVDIVQGQNPCHQVTPTAVGFCIPRLRTQQNPSKLCLAAMPIRSQSARLQQRNNAKGEIGFKTANI